MNFFNSLKNKSKAIAASLMLLTFSSVSMAAVPAEVTTVFTDLGTDVGTLLAAGAVLFGLIRGGTAILKISSRFFGAAGA